MRQGGGGTEVFLVENGRAIYGVRDEILFRVFLFVLEVPNARGAASREACW